MEEKVKRSREEVYITRMGFFDNSLLYDCLKPYYMLKLKLKKTLKPLIIMDTCSLSSFSGKT